MLLAATSFSDFILAIHILGVVVGFGATFAYPVIFTAAAKADPKITPWLWGTLKRIDRYMVNPGLLVVVLAGIYLASHGHYWGDFFVAWGIAAAVVIGGVVGSFMIPREGRLAELAARDLAAAGVAAGGAGAAEATGGSFAWSEEYQTLSGQVARVGGLLDLLVVITVFLMATHAGA